MYKKKEIKYVKKKLDFFLLTMEHYHHASLEKENNQNKMRKWNKYFHKLIIR